MIFGKTKMEMKVGIFVFVGLVLLFVFILSIGGFRTWTSGYKVNFTFHFVNGVKLGAPVRYAGVDVGEVKRINFITKPGEPEKIELACWIKKEVNIPMDSTIWVNTLGLLGEKYVEIMPGKDYTKFLAAGESLVGIDPIPMHEVFRMAKGIGENINAGVVRINSGEGTIGKLLYNDTIYNELEALVIDIRKHPWKLFVKTKDKPEKK